MSIKIQLIFHLMQSDECIKACNYVCALMTFKLGNSPSIPCHGHKFLIVYIKYEGIPITQLFPRKKKNLYHSWECGRHLSVQVRSELQLGKGSSGARLSLPQMHRNPAIVLLSRGFGI